MKQSLHVCDRGLVVSLLLTLAMLCPMALMAEETTTEGTWHKTIIVQTRDNATMEYVIDKDTKVRIERPNLVIETEGMVLTYELENMSQVRYGKKFIPTGIGNLPSVSSAPFKHTDDILFFEKLKDNTLISILSADGKTMQSRRYSGNAQISLRELATGVYFVKLNDATYKILKK